MIFQTSIVFKANYDSTADVVVNQGGTDSGKTYAILQVLAVIASTTKAPSSDPIISIVNESVPNSRKGAYRIFKSIAADNKFLKSKIVNWNEGDRTIHFKTGWVMEFLGAIDEQNAKQGKRQYLFVNEANGISWPVFWQYAKRTRIRTFIDYNPSEPFWAHDKLINTTKESNDLHATVQLIISDHRHNPFLSENDHNKTENILDPELWKVYARGLTGNLSGIIFPNWKVIPDADYPWDNDRKVGGLDFGYTNDPTAAVRVTRIGNKLYIHELCYESAMTPTMIKQLFKSVGFKSETPVYCDHDGDMIKQLRMKGLYAFAATKGIGSIRAGILKLSEYEVYYTASSKNIAEERKRYMWLKDKDSGKSLNEPIDQFNHLMDAIRYAVYSHFYKQS